MNTSKVNSWNNEISLLKSRKNKNLDTLTAAGYKKLKDLLWIIPRKVETIPGVRPFSDAIDGETFKGIGIIKQVQSKMNFYARGKGKVPLYNLTVTVKDLNSDGVLSLKFFNCYPNVQKKLKGLEKILFYGKISTYAGMRQIANPNYTEYKPDDELPEEELEISYPTINKVNGSYINDLITSIPNYLWDNISESLPSGILQVRKLLPLQEAFKTIHGKYEYDENHYKKAKERLIYEEFFQDQIKINIRKKVLTGEGGKKHSVSDSYLKKSFNIFPYELTPDQKSTINQIKNDLNSGMKMMRLVQGDVGCGKTSVALCAALMSIESRYQVAMMAPTESLALQHFLNFRDLLKKTDIRIEIILGGTKKAEKERIYNLLANGEIDFIIGTHSLIQDKVEFKNLGLAIIDEQHKFGVNQRIKLTSKNEGVHCLIMSATPIPRSLSLTQYGDLEISTIKSIPSNRKGTKTKIVTPDTFEKFLTFLNTRMAMQEQAYLVVPAIEENEETGLVNLERIEKQFRSYFPNNSIATIHGKFTSEEKENVFNKFKDKKIDILISTSVIEVGIDVANATIMAIFGPERFGLSSLHQLRGRVGRGQKPGFCFLILEKKIASDSMARLEVIEKSNDGFEIAEKDLELRGEGNIFGPEQSGTEKTKILANIITHHQVLEMARDDVLKLESEDQSLLDKYKKYYIGDQYFTQTI